MGTFPLTYNGGSTYKTLHDLITLIILLIGTSRYKYIQYIKYTSEYIPNLQIHQQLGGLTEQIQCYRITFDTPANDKTIDRILNSLSVVKININRD